MTFIIIKLFILLIFLTESLCSPVLRNEIDPNTKDNPDPVPYINDKWIANFVMTNGNQIESCLVLPTKRRIFIGDAECIYHAAKKDHWAITIDFYHSETKYVDMAYVQDKNIFYNTNLSRTYDPNERKIAFLFTDQPVLADNHKDYLLGSAQLAYEEVPGFNEKNQIKKILFDLSDNNYSMCFMPVFNRPRMSIKCFEISDVILQCLHTFTNDSMLRYDKALNSLFCKINTDESGAALVGILSRVNKPSVIDNMKEVSLDFENVDDLCLAVIRKMKTWYKENAKNGYTYKYPIY